MAEVYTNVSEDASAPTKSSPLQLLVCWLVVGLPLAWGIIETLKKSVALFH